MAVVRGTRRLVRRVRRAFSYEGHARWRRDPVRAGTVLYESFAGNGMLCNPEAIFRELRAAKDLQHLEHTWVLASRQDVRAARARFRDDPGVRVVRYRSSAYFRALATSQYLVNNATFPPEFGKREGQTYLNTWHGTPLKHMGYDMPDGAFESANTLRNFLQADYLLSASPFMTHTMYESAYRLKGIFRGRIIEEGYPRIDRQRLGGGEYLDVRAELERRGLALGTRDIVLYAPTWKGESFARPEDDIAELVDAVEELQARLGDDRFVVLLKTHQSVHRYAGSDPRLRRVLVPNDIPSNVVLGASSALVTDYSSIFIDFLATGRPVFFFVPDMSDYSDARGLYFPASEWPGPVCSTVEELAARIDSAGRDAPSDRGERYREWQRRFAPYEDGAASARVVDIVFRGRTLGRRVLEAARDPRTSVLIYLGGMRSNGITSSALNLLAAIDHEHFDVSVVFARTNRGQSRGNQRRIDKRVRQLPRQAGMNGSKLTHVRRRLSDSRAVPSVGDPAFDAMWEGEWSRVFGDARFDLVVDFSGYSPFWASLLLHSPEAKRSIWLHNDMAADAQRAVRGRRLRRGLLATFSLYRAFDRLVSVSEALETVNRVGLAGYAASGQFTSSRNLIDGDHVLAGATADVRELDGHPVDPETELVVVPDWAEQLVAPHTTRWFVTVGRFSPEKNQARLLRSFAAVHRNRPESRLLIVGYGPLRESLERLVEELGLRGVAHVVGPFPNPFAIMAACDCFVLSSEYEGQPMVLLEAAVLGMPIVSVDFESVRGALPDGSMRIVAQSDAALEAGMLAFLDGAVPRSALEVARYNADAAAEFARAIGAPAATRLRG